jgi:hypothetical protein
LPFVDWPGICKLTSYVLDKNSSTANLHGWISRAYEEIKNMTVLMINKVRRRFNNSIHPSIFSLIILYFSLYFQSKYIWTAVVKP